MNSQTVPLCTLCEREEVPGCAARGIGVTLLTSPHTVQDDVFICETVENTLGNMVSFAPLTDDRRVVFKGARSSAVEHCLDMAGVTGSIPVVPTI